MGQRVRHVEDNGEDVLTLISHIEDIIDIDVDVNNVEDQTVKDFSSMDTIVTDCHTIIPEANIIVSEIINELVESMKGRYSEVLVEENKLKSSDTEDDSDLERKAIVIGKDCESVKEQMEQNKRGNFVKELAIDNSEEFVDEDEVGIYNRKPNM